MTEFHLPELGENIETGDVVKVAVKVGDKITKDQIVLELETDKAVVEVPSNLGGVVKKIHVKEGDKAKVGQVILSLEGAENSNEFQKPKPVPQKTDPKPEVPSETKGKKEPGNVTQIHTVKITDPKPETATQTEAAPLQTETDNILASPSVRKLAREIGVDIHTVRGSGTRGRILEDDVKKSARHSQGPADARPGTKNITEWGETEIKPMTNVRLKTAQRMTAAWLIPSVTQNDEADITELEDLRKKYSERALKAGGSLTLTAILIKIVASALKVFPNFNSSVNMDAQEIIYKKYFNIGVAVDTDRGLLVPVIRDADRKNILEISIDLNDMAVKARDRKISPDDLQGSTFTITNLGGIGGGHFSPIINPPNVAILGVGRYKMEPVFTDGEFKPRKILPLSLTYDHRIIDGADAARFLRWIVEAMNQPFLMGLEG